MAVTVILPNALRPLAAFNERVFLEAGSAREALDKLFERYPELKRKLPDDLGQPPAGTALYRNGKDLRSLQQLDTPLSPRDRLTIIIPEGDL